MTAIIQTWGGGRLDLQLPDARDINLHDIARALGNLCRFTGHSLFHYSVAQHCVVVSHLSAPHGFRKEGLFHDAAEAYLGDVSTPLKAAMRHMRGKDSEYDELTKRLERIIAKKFGLLYPWPAAVKHADGMALAIERRDVMMPSIECDWPKPPGPLPPDMRIMPMSPNDAAEAWLQTFKLIEAGVLPNGPLSKEGPHGPVAAIH